MKTILTTIALLFAAGVVAAQEATPSVEVQGVKNPDMRSYRAVVAGLDAFEEHHALAPAVPELRFRLSARGSAELPAGDALYLRIVGNGEPIPVPVTADGSFTVPRVQSAVDDDADLVLNRKKGVLKGRPDIRTPGLAENVRRLGDLRTPEEKADPWLQNMFVIGSLNHKPARIPLHKAGEGVYTAEVELGKGSHFINAGTRGLADISLGAAKADQQLAEGGATPLAKRGKRLHIKVENAGRYVITLDARDKEAPTLRLHCFRADDN